MAIPIAALITTLGPILLGGLLAGRKSEEQIRDPEEMIQGFIEQWGKFFQPGKAAAVNAARVAGTGVGQQLDSSLGTSGALSSGTGRVSSAVGGTLSTLNAGQAEQTFLNQTAQMANSSFAATVQGGGLQKPNSGTENMLAFFADLISNPETMKQLVGLPGKFKNQKTPQPFNLNQNGQT